MLNQEILTPAVHKQHPRAKYRMDPLYPSTGFGRSGGLLNIANPTSLL